jgi:hypothetical protein
MNHIIFPLFFLLRPLSFSLSLFAYTSSTGKMNPAGSNQSLHR